MTSELIVFLVLSLVAVSSALGMILSRNAVYSALFLVLNFVTVAVFVELGNVLLGYYYVRVVGVNGVWDVLNPYQLRIITPRGR